MEEIVEGDGPFSSFWSLSRRYALYLLSICLCAGSNDAAAAEYWRVEQPGVTAFVQGSRALAKRVAGTTLHMQSTVRGLLNWPDTYRDPPVLIFSLDERVLRRTFDFSRASNTAFSDYEAGHESWTRTPTLVVVAAAMGYENGQELRSLQRTFGGALLAAAPSHDWPPCVQLGMSLLLAGAEFSPPNHLFVSSDTLRGASIVAGETWSPERFLTPKEVPMGLLSERELDQAAYSCLRLSFMIASAGLEERAALAQMLTTVGRGIPLGEATMSELDMTLPEFKTRFREFKPRDVRLDLRGEMPAPPEPVAIPYEQLHAVMETLCGKLHNCRH